MSSFHVFSDLHRTYGGFERMSRVLLGWLMADLAIALSECHSLSCSVKTALLRNRIQSKNVIS